MKKTLIFLIAISVMLSCKKSSTSDETKDGSTNPCLVSEANISIDGHNNKITFSYDNKGNILAVVYHDSEIASTYTYTSATITQNSSAGWHNDTQVYLLDTQGRIKSVGSTSFKYNSEGYMIEKVVDGTITKYTWSDGNLTKIGEATLEYSTETRPANYTDNFALYLRTDVRAEDGMLTKYFGKQSKNLVSKINGSSGAYEGTYTYLKDDKGNITKMTLKNKYGGNDVYSYKYTCK